MKRNTKKRRNRYYAFLVIVLGLLMITSCSGSAASQTGSADSKAEETTGTTEITEKTEAKTETTEKTEAETETADKAEVVWEEQDVLKGAEASDIKSISYSFFGEEGETSGTIDDRDDIEDIYLRLCNITLGVPVNIGIEDASLYVTVALADQELKFHFEDDYVDLGNTLYEAKHVDSLRTYLWEDAEDDADESDDDAGEPDDDVTEETAKAEIVEDISEEADDIENDDYKVFASETLNFSFLYDAGHTAYLTESGVARLAINGDESRTGLFVSVMDAENMPTVDQILEEEAFNAKMHYQNALNTEAERQDLEIEGHSITGIMYTYSNPSGNIILSTYFVEVRDRKYIFYKTKGIYGGEGDELVAMGAAMVSMQFDAGAYGASDAVPGDLPEDEFSQ